MTNEETVFCRGEVYGTTITQEEYLSLTADQLRNIWRVECHWKQLVRRLDGVLCEFELDNEDFEVGKSEYAEIYAESD